MEDGYLGCGCESVRFERQEKDFLHIGILKCGLMDRRAVSNDTFASLNGSDGEYKVW